MISGQTCKCNQALNDKCSLSQCQVFQSSQAVCISYFGLEGLPGILGNKGTLPKYPREQGNMSLFLGNRGTKLYKLEGENIVSKFITRKTNTENVWEHRNIGQFWKGTREQGPPMGDPRSSTPFYSSMCLSRVCMLRVQCIIGQ